MTEEEITKFLTVSRNICIDAEFTVSSFPNVELHAVQRHLRLLRSIAFNLTGVSEVQLPEKESISLAVKHLSIELEDFLNAPPLPRNENQTFEEKQPGQRGRPRIHVDMDRALELHRLGASWERVACSLGVTERTVWNRLEEMGLSCSTRPKISDLTDDELDEVVALISLEHPLAGYNIMNGHLKGKGYTIPISRVQESLRRVDPVGVALR